MTIRFLQEAPEPALITALERFESTFVYPLGEGREFRVSHGSDPALFFRAIGGAAAGSFVAVDRQGEVRGTLGIAIRPLRLPSGEMRQAAYVGDLKVAPGAARGFTLLRLAAQATSWALAHGATCAYGVVMDGTARVPSSYTGKLGLHGFRAGGQICVLRLPVTKGAIAAAYQAAPSDLQTLHAEYAMNACLPLGGEPGLRSLRPPRPLLAPERTACGIVEDTLRSKRLLTAEGEMQVAHLSAFAYRDVASGAALIQQALAVAASESGTQFLFTSVPMKDRDDFARLLQAGSGLVEAAATVYTTELDGDSIQQPWMVSSSEI